jgi:hypothetical protein
MSVVEVESRMRSVCAAMKARVVVVLARREDVEPDLFGLAGDRDRRLDALVLGGGAACGRVGGDVADREDPELHHGAQLLRCMRLHVVYASTIEGWEVFPLGHA